MKTQIVGLRPLSIAVILLLGFIGTSNAQDRGTRQEAIAMSDAAVAYVKKVGPDKAFDDFTKDKANWTKKDLYVYVLDLDGNVKAHGATEKLVGKNVINIKDQNGKELIKELVGVAAGKGDGWVDYEWANPQTKKIESKSTFIKRIAGTNFAVAVGIYR